MNVWDLYFASLVGMRLHPGFLREGAQAPSLEELAELANQMMEIRSCQQYGAQLEQQQLEQLEARIRDARAHAQQKKIIRTDINGK